MNMRDLSSHHADTNATFRADYIEAPLDRLLSDPGVLAVLGFGQRAPTVHADPRYINTGLEVLGATAPFEVWRTHGAVECGHQDDLAWSRDDALCFGALTVPEHAYGGMAETADAAYARLLDFMTTSSHPALLRVWNYVDAINDGSGDNERYRHFCLGRARGMQGRLDQYPAATAVGSRNGLRLLRIHWLAARMPGTHIENPRQVAAWRYPRQYGPQPPNFARATLAHTMGIPLLLSGTASVVGHATVHPHAVAAQTRETLNNLSSLLQTARLLRPGLAATLNERSLLKVYVRDPGEVDSIAQILNQHLPPATPRLFLQADICRADLRMEIDGFHL